MVARYELVVTPWLMVYTRLSSGEGISLIFEVNRQSMGPETTPFDAPAGPPYKPARDGEWRQNT
jgi:hypothetical protein